MSTSDSATLQAAYAAKRHQWRETHPPVSREELARLEEEVAERIALQQRLDASPEITGQAHG